MQVPYLIRNLVSRVRDDAIFDVYADPENIALKESVKRGFCWRTFVCPFWPSEKPIPVPILIGPLVLVSLFVLIRLSTDTNIVRTGLMCLESGDDLLFAVTHAIHVETSRGSMVREISH